MITARKALIGETAITVYSGNRSDAMPIEATAGDRFVNKDDHIIYIYGENGWKEEVEESELPALYNFDNGKVLTAQSGAWVKKTPQSGLPDVTASDNGKVATVVNGAWDKVASAALPDATASDNGKILQVSEGQWTKQTQEVRIIRVVFEYDIDRFYDEDFELYSASHTPREVRDKLRDGYIVRCDFRAGSEYDGDFEVYAYGTGFCENIIYDGEEQVTAFGSIEQSTGNNCLAAFLIGEDDRNWKRAGA